MTGEITIQAESKEWMLQLFSSTDFVENMKVVFGEHYEEIAVNKDILKLDPDLGQYRHLVRNDFFQVVTAREDGLVIGYFQAMIAANLHYRNVKLCVEDAHWVAKGYRGRGIGQMLFREMERVARERDARIIRVRTKRHSPNDDFLQKMGYRPVETIYEKVL